MSALPDSQYLVIHSNHCSELEKLKAKFNISRYDDYDQSEEYLYHRHVLQLWTEEFDEAKKEVEAWEADIERMQEKIDANLTGESVETENVHGTGEQLVMAVLQSQMDGVEINDAAGDAFEREDADTRNIDNANEDSNASSDEEDCGDSNGDGRNALHFGYEDEPSNEAINMTTRDGDF